MATKAQLLKTAKEFNEVMALDPAIKANSKITAAQLLDNIKEAAGEVRDDDKFSPEVDAVLIELGIREGAGKEEEERQQEADEEPAAEATETKTKKETKEKKKIDKKKSSNGVSGTAFITHLICDDPEISNSDIAKALSKKNYEVSKNTMAFHAGWTRRVMRYLQEKGRLK